MVEGSPPLLWKNLPSYRGRKSEIVEGSPHPSWKDFPPIVEGFPLRRLRCPPDPPKIQVCASFARIPDAFCFQYLTKAPRRMDCGRISPRAGRVRPHHRGRISPLITPIAQRAPDTIRFGMFIRRERGKFVPSGAFSHAWWKNFPPQLQMRIAMVEGFPLLDLAGWSSWWKDFPCLTTISASGS